ncbi:MAG: 50S ribosomal protein L24 [Holosporaceae bacterium]|jgi:large subunit ribosomal protein L24|nr:50S ribosomal protein L24 [Holosporaceae bacterium]
MNRWRIKKGDAVQVIAGKDRGVRGEILSVLREERRVIVKGVNLCVKHQKPSVNSPGGIVKVERSIHASNVMLLDSSDDKPTRVGVKIENEKKVRVSRRTGSVIG